MKKEKTTGSIFAEHLDGLEKSDFWDFKKPCKCAFRKKRSSPTSITRRKTSQNELVEKGRMPDRVDSFREVDCGKNRPRARLGFVKPIQNGLTKKQNLIVSRSSRVEIGLAERQSGARFQKKSRSDIMMCLKSFETQEMREIGRKKPG